MGSWKSSRINWVNNSIWLDDQTCMTRLQPTDESGWHIKRPLTSACSPFFETPPFIRPALSAPSRRPSSSAPFQAAEARIALSIPGGAESKGGIDGLHAAHFLVLLFFFKWESRLCQEGGPYTTASVAYPAEKKNKTYSARNGCRLLLSIFQYLTEYRDKKWRKNDKRMRSK